MNTKKVLLGSFVLAGAITACTNEEIIDVAQNDVALVNRPQVDLVLQTPLTNSRMITNGWDFNYETFDVLGAVLVDGGYSENGWHGVDWDVVEGHVGNNKWAYNKDNVAFETDGTTAIGSWLFYTKYNPNMTTARNGVEFDFPQIQEGSKNLEWVANNNINFQISPVVPVDGYEGQKLKFGIRMASVFNYLRMPFDFSTVGAKYVQKIIVTAKDENGVAVKFPTQYKVVNTNVPVAKTLVGSGAPEEYACEHHSGHDELTCLNEAMNEAYNKLTYATSSVQNGWEGLPDSYKEFVATRNTETDVDFLVVDFEDDHAAGNAAGGLAVAEDGKFSAVMLMPAGVYGSITFDIFTDAGVYAVTVDSQNEYIEYDDDDANDSEIQGLGKVFLRPGRVTVLSDIRDGRSASYTAETLEDGRYIKAEEKSEMEGYITKTADLVNFINGIQKSGVYDVPVLYQAQVGDDLGDKGDEVIPEHTSLINQAVMDAIDAKEAEVGDIQLNITCLDKKAIKVVGGASEENTLVIHDMTFNTSCELVSGYVKVANGGNSTQLIIPENQKMLVKSGVNLVLNNLCQQYEEFASLEVESGANVTVENYLWIDEVINNGKIVAKTELESKNLTNNGTVEAKKLLKVENTLNNTGSITSGDEMLVNGKLINDVYATITNNGTLTLGTDSEGSKNNGKIVNNNVMYIEGNLDNSNIITNAKNATISVQNVASLNNKVGATIVNEGSMFCISGTDANKINNLGTIEAKNLSSTYITTNSSADESNGTNLLTMGTIVLDNRDEDVSVTVGTQQGYIQYAVPAEVTTLSYKTGDKFNKVILSNGNMELNDSENRRVKYVVVNSDMKLTLPATSTIQIAEFNANTVLNVVPVEGEIATIAQVKVANNVEVKVPTENALKVYSVANEMVVAEKTIKSMTYADIKNQGTILVGGDLYSTLPATITNNNGTFASGDGQMTAFHWGQGDTQVEEPVTGNGYVMMGNIANVSTSDGFNTVLAMDMEDVVINLEGDVEYSKAIQMQATGSITINAANHTVKFFGEDVSLTTLGAKLIINDAEVKNAGRVGQGSTWNNHDLRIECEVEMNNVTSDCAIAFVSEKSATLNNVTINDANTNATYAIWISPVGQTVSLDNCTIDMLACSEGRGIKIDEQYVAAANVKKVTLNVSNTSFKTEKKAAIMVKSVAGADINLSNVDITGVADDTNNAVWVDEDSKAYANEVKVNGGSVVVE